MEKSRVDGVWVATLLERIIMGAGYFTWGVNGLVFYQGQEEQLFEQIRYALKENSFGNKIIDHVITSIQEYEDKL